MAEDDTHPPMSYQLHTSDLENPQTAGHASSRYRLGSFRSGPHLGRVSGPHGLFPDDVAGYPKRVWSWRKRGPAIGSLGPMARLDLVVDSIVSEEPSSSSRVGEDSVAGWSWILQYLSDTEEDLLMERALFTDDEETEELLPSFTLEPSPALLSSSSRSTESESPAPAMFLMDFAGAGSAGERSEKSVDLDLEGPKILMLE
ncbi:hypothetical protein OIU85_030404 [Salix viminalis]|uniref:Uncharacterized protein n=1 Tax=Salix viminalis TaxID=40686 RepID=A0A9Q0QDF0_SALVM|nr:hypothetical protein OIU85_030404 [Salix viminalis]